MRRRPLVFATISFVLVLTSCTGSASPSPAASAAGASPGEAGSSGEPTLAGELNIPAYVWGDNSESPFWKEVKGRVEGANPGLTIKASAMAFDGYHDTVFADMQAGNPPDIVFPFDPQLAQWSTEGLLEPLDPWLEEAGIDLNDHIPASQLAVRDGHIYGVIASSNPRVLIYNQALLDAAGVGVPTDVDEFVDALRAIRDPETQTFGYATMSASAPAPTTYLEIMPIVAGFGGAFFEDGVPTANAAETVAALELIKTLHDENLIPQGQDQNVYRPSFIQGKVAMLTIGEFILAQVAEENPEAFETMQATQLPFPGGGTIAVNVFIAIPAGAANKEAAAEFITTMLSESLQPEVARVQGALPATAGAVPEDYLEANPAFQAAVDAGEVAVSYAPDGVGAQTGEVLEAITARYQELLFTDATAQEIGDLLQADLEAIVGG